MAELLVRASGHWLDSKTQAQVDAMSAGDRQSYNARSQVGDIIVVKPDGWVWGLEECLPTFIVVKLPGVSEEESKYYEQGLIDNTNPEHPVLLKRRKYQVPSDIIQTQIDLAETVIEIPAGKGEETDPIETFMLTIIEKTS